MARPFDLVNELGTGEFGVKMFKGGDRTRKNGGAVAIKILQISRDDDGATAILNEVELLRSFRHEHLVSYFSCFQFHGEMWIVTEHILHGSVLDVLKTIMRKKAEDTSIFDHSRSWRGIFPSDKNSNVTTAQAYDSQKVAKPYGSAEETTSSLVLSEESMSDIVRQTLCGLHHLHSVAHVYHGNLKCSNIMICTNGVIKIADFGLKDKLVEAFSKRNTFTEIKPHWTPPELISHISQDSSIQRDQKKRGISLDDGSRGDVWSLGISMIEMAEGRPPLWGRPPMEVLHIITNDRPPSLQKKNRYDINNVIKFSLAKVVQLSIQTSVDNRKPMM